jgi:hypothetical protein
VGNLEICSLRRLIAMIKSQMQNSQIDGSLKSFRLANSLFMIALHDLYEIHLKELQLFCKVNFVLPMRPKS